MKTAVVFGSSGFVGSHLLSALLESPDYSQVTTITRRSLSIAHPRLKTVIGDYHSLTNVEAEMAANEVFLTLGTTRANSPDQAAYYQVDHDYPVLAARLAKERGATSAFLVTSVGADVRSSVSYLRTKGETERDVIALDFERTHIFRPSMIIGNRAERRPPLEDALMRFWSASNPLLIGKADRFKGITGADLAKAMMNAARNQARKLMIYHWRDMRDLLPG